MGFGNTFGNLGGADTRSGNNGTGSTDFGDPGTILSLFEGLPEPAPRDFSGELNEILDTLIGLAPRQFAAEAEYRPQYAQLDADIYRSILPQITDANVSAIEQFAPRAQRTFEQLADARPQSEIQRLLEGYAIDDLKLGREIAPEQARLVEEASRGAYAARGMERSGASVADELYDKFALGEQMRDKRMGFAAELDRYLEDLDNRSAAQAVGMTAQAGMPQAAQITSMAGPRQFDPQSGYAANLYGQNLELDSSLYNSNANLLAGLYGGQIQMNAARDAAAASRSAGNKSFLGSILGGGLSALGMAAGGGFFG